MTTPLTGSALVLIAWGWRQSQAIYTLLAVFHFHSRAAECEVLALQLYCYCDPPQYMKNVLACQKCPQQFTFVGLHEYLESLKQSKKTLWLVRGLFGTLNPSATSVLQRPLLSDLDHYPVQSHFMHINASQYEQKIQHCLIHTLKIQCLKEKHLWKCYMRRFIWGITRKTLK